MTILPSTFPARSLQQQTVTSRFGTKTSPILVDTDMESSSSSAPSVHQPSPQPQLCNKPIREPRLLLGLPIELLKIITNSTKLSNVDRHSLKMTTRSLRRAEFDTATMAKKDYILFNKQLEAGLPSRHCLLAQNLLCSKCLVILPKSAFPDSHARPACTPPRKCLQCSVTAGQFNRRRFLFGGEEHFVCGACKEVKLVSIMEDLDDELEMILWQRFGGFRTVALSVQMKKRRWCRQCWTTITGFWDFVREEGKMKEVYRGEEHESD